MIIALIPSRLKSKRLNKKPLLEIDGLPIIIHTLKRVLLAAERILKPGGRFVVVCFHSIEDKIVKNFLKEKSGALAGTSRHLPQQLEAPTQSTFDLINKRVIKPTIQEVNNNRRARSARLRAAVRTSV